MATVTGMAANGAADDGRVVVVRVGSFEAPPVTFIHDSGAAAANEGFNLPGSVDLVIDAVPTNVAFRYMWDPGAYGYWELLWLGIPPVAPVEFDIGPHEADSDPHSVYQKESEKGNANGYASLTSSSLVPGNQLGTGSLSTNTFLSGTGVFTTLPFPLAAVPAVVSVASVSNVTVATMASSGPGVGGTLMVDIWATLLNDSGGSRVYIITLDIGAAFSMEFTTPSIAANATNEWVIHAYGVMGVEQALLSRSTVQVDLSEAGSASGGDMTLATSAFHGMRWASTTANLSSGTKTTNLFIRSDSATATQTCRLVSSMVQRYKP